MFVYPPGCGINGTPRLFRPGDELVFSSSFECDSKVCHDEPITVQDSHVGEVSSQRTYNSPLGNDQMEVLSHKDFSKETKKKMKWVLKMYNDWRIYRNSSEVLGHIECDLEDKSTISQSSLNFAVPRFITEVKKLDGTDFPGRTLYDIVICIQFHLESIGFAWKLLNQDGF